MCFLEMIFSLYGTEYVLKFNITKTKSEQPLQFIILSQHSDMHDLAT